MAQKESDLSAIPSGKKYVIAWITAQIIGNLPWLVPWLASQVKAAQETDAHLEAPEASTVIFAGTTLLVSTVLVFMHKVWKELEADAVKGAANLIRKFPDMAGEILSRFGDALWGFSTYWFIRVGFTRLYLTELGYRYGLFNDKGLGLINASRLNLDTVYVELKACPGGNLNNSNLNLVSNKLRKTPDRAPLWEYLRNHPRAFAIVIIGAPGCGKTTLLHHVLLTYARRHQWRHRMRFRLPIFIELRRVAPELPDDPKKSPDLAKLIEIVWKKDSRNAGIIKRMPKGWLTNRLRSGRCLLLWDGLDEVADPVERSKVRDWAGSCRNK
ncbi:MAG: NACHT domain-containing protein [Prosthecobacter sp.]